MLETHADVADRNTHIRHLAEFRHRFYTCLTPWGDALFELCDATLSSTSPVASVPSLSLEPVFRRSHGSLYKALADGGGCALLLWPQLEW